MLFRSDAGLRIIDLSGLYTRGPLAGLPIPPEQRGSLIDEDGDREDDRIIGRYDSTEGQMLSVAYPPEGGRRLYVGVGSLDTKQNKYVGGSVAQFDIGDPSRPTRLSSAKTSPGPAFGVDVRGQRLLAAAGIAGMQGFDISYSPFLLNTLRTDAEVDAKEASALAVEGAFAVLGTGTWKPSGRFDNGKLHSVRVEGVPEKTDSMPLSVQRVRLRSGLAVVAAGDSGLVLVDLGANGKLTQRGRVPKEELKGFA